jgi:hypothetical protein
MERAAGQAHADAVLADNRLRAQGAALVLVGACPACRTTQAVDLRTLDRHPWSALTGLIPALSCPNSRPHAPFAELIRLSDKSVADEMRDEHARHILGR